MSHSSRYAEAPAAIPGEVRSPRSAGVRHLGCSDSAPSTHGDPWRCRYRRHGSEGVRVIPAPSGPLGLLPEGCHRTTLAEIEDVFVQSAPFPAERVMLWATFRTYVDHIWRLMPSTRLWINGGFVTHKTWAAPRDVDVCLVVRVAEFDAVPGPVIDPLLTKFLPNGQRLQPMAGAVDAFTAERGNPDQQHVYRKEWSRVRGPDRLEVPGAIKGYLEVLAP